MVIYVTEQTVAIVRDNGRLDNRSWMLGAFQVKGRPEMRIVSGDENIRKLTDLNGDILRVMSAAVARTHAGA